jgi:hypothetical protein
VVSLKTQFYKIAIFNFTNKLRNKQLCFKKKIKILINFMYKLSEDINKSLLFNEFMKKVDFLNIPRFCSKEAICLWLISIVGILLYLQ